jgi:hypothetical protein
VQRGAGGVEEEPLHRVYTHRWEQHPERLKEGESEINAADVAYENGTPKLATRLTHFTEYKGTAADNAVVRDDGKRMAFQMGKRGAESGEGFGVFLLDLRAAGAE